MAAMGDFPSLCPLPHTMTGAVVGEKSFFTHFTSNARVISHELPDRGGAARRVLLAAASDAHLLMMLAADNVATGPIDFDYVELNLTSLARSVLFIGILSRLPPAGTAERDAALERLWRVWQDRKLTKAEHAWLMDEIDACLADVDAGAVAFGRPSDREAVRGALASWRGMTATGASRLQLAADQRRAISDSLEDDEGVGTQLAAHLFYLLGPDPRPTEKRALSMELANYAHDGVTPALDVSCSGSDSGSSGGSGWKGDAAQQVVVGPPALDTPARALTHLNPTMLQPSTGNFCGNFRLHVDSPWFPLRADEMQGELQALVARFKAQPGALAAFCAQQLLSLAAEWADAARPLTTVRWWLGDLSETALQHLPRGAYDLIETADLLDELGPPNLLVCTVPLLRREEVAAGGGGASAASSAGGSGGGAAAGGAAPAGRPRPVPVIRTQPLQQQPLGPSGITSLAEWTLVACGVPAPMLGDLFGAYPTAVATAAPATGAAQLAAKGLADCGEIDKAIVITNHRFLDQNRERNLNLQLWALPPSPPPPLTLLEALRAREAKEATQAKAGGKGKAAAAGASPIEEGMIDTLDALAERCGGVNHSLCDVSAEFLNCTPLTLYLTMAALARGRCTEPVATMEALLRRAGTRMPTLATSLATLHALLGVQLGVAECVEVAAPPPATGGGASGGGASGGAQASGGAAASAADGSGGANGAAGGSSAAAVADVAVAAVPPASVLVLTPPPTAVRANPFVAAEPKRDRQPFQAQPYPRVLLFEDPAGKLTGEALIAAVDAVFYSPARARSASAMLGVEDRVSRPYAGTARALVEDRSTPEGRVKIDARSGTLSFTPHSKKALLPDAAGRIIWPAGMPPILSQKFELRWHLLDRAELKLKRRASELTHGAVMLEFHPHSFVAGARMRVPLAPGEALRTSIQEARAALVVVDTVSLTPLTCAMPLAGMQSTWLPLSSPALQLPPPGPVLTLPSTTSPDRRVTLQLRGFAVSATSYTLKLAALGPTGGGVFMFAELMDGGWGYNITARPSLPSEAAARPPGEQPVPGSGPSCAILRIPVALIVDRNPIHQPTAADGTITLTLPKVDGAADALLSGFYGQASSARAHWVRDVVRPAGMPLWPQARWKDGFPVSPREGNWKSSMFCEDGACFDFATGTVAVLLDSQFTRDLSRVWDPADGAPPPTLPPLTTEEKVRNDLRYVLSTILGGALKQRRSVICYRASDEHRAPLPHHEVTAAPSAVDADIVMIVHSVRMERTRGGDGGPVMLLSYLDMFSLHHPRELEIAARVLPQVAAELQAQGTRVRAACVEAGEPARMPAGAYDPTALPAHITGSPAELCLLRGLLQRGAALTEAPAGVAEAWPAPWRTSLLRLDYCEPKVAVFGAFAKRRAGTSASRSKTGHPDVHGEHRSQAAAAKSRAAVAGGTGAASRAAGAAGAAGGAVPASKSTRAASATPAATGAGSSAAAAGNGAGATPSNLPPASGCVVCGAKDEDVEEGLKRCNRCERAWYCGRDCQKKDWKAGHKAVCAPPGSA